MARHNFCWFAVYDTSEERALFKQRYGIEVLKLEEIDNFNDIDGLASLIDADCVMSVSNTTVHIAGAIGKEIYLMLPGRKIMVLVKRRWKKYLVSLLIIEQTKING